MPTAKNLFAKKKVARPEVKVITRTFLMDLARHIHDGNNKTYLNLCTGTLQNGPDPKDKERPMHCGLGELYYAVTGRQPEQDHVDEGEVVALVVERSTLFKKGKIALQDKLKKYKIEEKEAEKAIKAMPVSENVKRSLLSRLEDAFYDDRDGSIADDTVLEDFLGGDEGFDSGGVDEKLDEFASLLRRIPDINDDGNDTGTDVDDDGNEYEMCTPANFKERAKRVAARIRQAAKLLPAD